MNYARHTLCFIYPNSLPLSNHTKEELDLLDFWLRHRYPLIVTRQPEKIHQEDIHLALPFFDNDQMKKIRLGFLFSKTAIQSSKELPILEELFPHVQLDFEIRVYGSYCWEYLTGQSYINQSSDLDLQIIYHNESLSALKLLHQQLSEGLNSIALDGEVRFPNLGDCAWLELIQEDFSPSVLIKCQQHVTLIKRRDLYAKFPTLHY